MVVITHNSAEVLGSCLDSLRGVFAEAVVVDNASTDESLAIARRHALAGEVEVIANLGNRGFAGAANQAFRATGSKCVLLLNPDAVLERPVDLGRMVEVCEEFGLASGLLVDLAGVPQSGFFTRSLPTPVILSFEALGLNRLWPSNPVNRRYRCLDLAPDRESFVEQPAGALVMIRRDVWERLGGLDEEFHPVWFEDADFCRRALDAGYKIRFTPSVRARHEGGHSVLRVERKTREVLWYGSLLRYALKHFGAPGFRLVCVSVALGAAGRMVVAGFGVRGWAETVRMYGSIMRLAAGSCWSGSVPAAGRPQADEKSVVSVMKH